MSGYQFETSIFFNQDEAAAAVERLQAYGLSPSDISVMLDQKTRAEIASTLEETSATEGLAAGGAVGGILGAIIASLTATGSVAAIAFTGGAAAPLVAGPLAAALAGLGLGATGGGIAGALIGIGIGQKRAKEYERGLLEGGILIAARPRSDDERAVIRRAFEAVEPSVTTGEIESDVSKL